MINYFLKFQTVYQDKINRLIHRLKDIEAEVPELNQKKEEAEVKQNIPFL